jgi:hypothetical protein
MHTCVALAIFVHKFITKQLFLRDKLAVIPPSP